MVAEVSLAGARTAISSLSRTVADFPAPGIVFRDLTPVLADASGFAAVVAALAHGCADVEVVAGIDARGFLLGGAVAQHLGVGVLAVRKSGKLPPPVLARTYDLEYGTATLEIPADSLDLAGRRALIVDDVLATGGTIAATAGLLDEAGARVVGVAVAMELTGLGGRAAVERSLPRGTPIRTITSA
ncbi:adenine phosphoribosyltransferase [Gordonia sp. (in: high G+C Gram-positive bacteria)]|uniref:adenine phosphoribosyltransferase n=1 Tax=Gordonia sp. (in: high G+C Gram-positive bacteria) TaxID=84139 RepID=UPI0039E2C57D